jgi:hypothetical protein
VSGQGGEEVGPFEASLIAPRSFPSLMVEPLRRGPAGVSDLDLRWSAADEVSEALLVELKWSSRAGSRAVRCRVRDDGEFTVPREVFDSLPPAALLSSAVVTASRVARTPFSASGAGRGEFTVELRDVAPLQVAQ